MVVVMLPAECCYMEEAGGLLDAIGLACMIAYATVSYLCA